MSSAHARWEFLISAHDALAHPVTRWVCIGVGGILVLALPAAYALRAAGLLTPKTFVDIRTRTLTWMVLAPAMLGAIVWCPLSAMLGVTAAALLCYREFARATGLFRYRVLSALVVLAMLVMAGAMVGGWYGLFVAVPAMTMAVLAGFAVLPDEPKGYLRRLGLAGTGFLLFGAGLLHLGYIANDARYRPVLCLLLLCVQGSDIAAYCVGKAIGRRKVFPNTSPNKTLGGHLGALVISTALFFVLGRLVFAGTSIQGWTLGALAVMVAAGAQLGDLVLGSIKRDIGIKDMAATLPGHGGFLDRFNSFLPVAPITFHFMHHLMDFGAGTKPS